MLRVAPESGDWPAGKRTLKRRRFVHWPAWLSTMSNAESGCMRAAAAKALRPRPRADRRWRAASQRRSHRVIDTAVRGPALLVRFLELRHPDCRARLDAMQMEARTSLAVALLSAVLRLSCPAAGGWAC